MIDDEYDGIDDGDFVEEADEQYPDEADFDPASDPLLGDLPNTEEAFYEEETDELVSDVPPEDADSSDL